MLNTIQLQKLVFLDIETVSQFETFDEMPEEWQLQWQHKMRFTEENASDLYTEKAALYAEFSKVICIGLGFFVGTGEEMVFRQKVISATSEKVVLEKFSEIINQNFENKKFNKICGHNIKSFDIPFLCKRFVINSLQLPKAFVTENLRPWEIPFVDTLKLWQFGEYKQKASLSLLAMALGLNSPKPLKNFTSIHNLYWQKNDLKTISQYAKNDVLTTARVVLKLKGMNDIDLTKVFLIE